MSAISLVPGQLFAGEFEIVRELSEGGMGIVYVARQQSTGALRALKVMQPSLVSSRDSEQAQKNRARFLAEARIGSRIASSHVVQVAVAGIDPEQGAPWLAMELLQGEELKTALEARGRFSPSEVLDLFTQLTHALGAAHRAGIVHLDLKPENIFLALSDDARVTAPKIKVLDFGIARLVSEHRQAATMTTAMGSPYWMSPEQAQRGGRVGPWSDVWALGLIAFRLLTGKHYWREGNVPNHEASLTAWLMEMMTAEIEPATVRAREFGVSPWLPPGFDAWFSRCVNRDPDARFADASAAMAELPRALAVATPPAPTVMAPMPMPPSVTQAWPQTVAVPIATQVSLPPVFLAPPQPATEGVPSTWTRSCCQIVGAVALLRCAARASSLVSDGGAGGLAARALPTNLTLLTAAALLLWTRYAQLAEARLGASAHQHRATRRQWTNALGVGAIVWGALRALALVIDPMDGAAGLFGLIPVALWAAGAAVLLCVRLDGVRRIRARSSGSHS